MANLLRLPNLPAADVRVADLVFEFVQFLLDDDANLTPAGNLTGAARQRLRSRLEELMAAEEAGSALGDNALTDPVVSPGVQEPAEGV